MFLDSYYQPGMSLAWSFEGPRRHNLYTETGWGAEGMAVSQLRAQEQPRHMWQYTDHSKSTPGVHKPTKPVLCSTSLTKTSGVFGPGLSPCPEQGLGHERDGASERTLKTDACHSKSFVTVS